MQRKGILVIFILATLLGTAACVDRTEPDFSAAPESSQSESAVQPSRSERSSVDDSHGFPRELQGKTGADIIADLTQGEYVTYTYTEAPSHADAHKNLHLLDEWVEKYRSGEPSSLWLMEEELDGQSCWLLESDGTESYSIYVPRGDAWQRHTSRIVVKRETDYVFGADRLEEWFAVWQYKVVRHTVPTISRIEDYDLEALPALGETTPERAAEIAKRWELSVYSHFANNASGNFSGKGQYFPDDYAQTELDADRQIRLDETLQAVALAAVMMDDRPFYVFGVAADLEMGFGSIYAINADGGHLVYDVSVNGYEFRLWGDSKQESISLTESDHTN